MISKTQNIAMFAVAAFALGGVAVGPAYAATNSIDMLDEAVSGDTEYTYEYHTGLCGGGGTGSTEIWVAESDPGSEDSVKAEWDLSCGVSFDDIDITWYKKVSGNWEQQATHNSSSQDAYVIFNASGLVGGDEVKVNFTINY